MGDNAPQYCAFRHKIAARSEEFDGALNRAAMIFVAGDARRLMFNVELGPGIDVVVTLERR